MKQAQLVQVRIKSAKTGHYLAAVEGLSRDKRLSCREGAEPVTFLLDGDLSAIALKVLGRDLWLGYEKGSGIVKLLDCPVGAHFSLLRREAGTFTLKSTQEGFLLWLKETTPLVSRAGKPGQKEAQWVIEGLGGVSVPTEKKTAMAPSFTLGEGFVPFGQGYAPPRVQLLEEGVVLLSGALKLNGTQALLGVLAPEFRPRYRVMQLAGREPKAAGTRVDILPDGRLYLVTGPNTAGGLLSLTGMVFPLQEGSPFPYSGRATGYGSEYGDARMTPLVGGLVLLSGAVKNGLNSFGQLPEDKRPAESGIFASWTGGRADRIDISAGGGVKSTFLNNGWVALSRTIYPVMPGDDVSVGGVPYGYGFTQPRARRLGTKAVALRGVVKFTQPTAILTLPMELRPKMRHVFPVWYAPFAGGGQQLGSLSILPTGVVQLLGVENGEAWVSLDGILFPLG